MPQTNTTNRRNLIKTAAAVLTGAPLATSTRKAALPPKTITQAELREARDLHTLFDARMQDFSERPAAGAGFEDGPIVIGYDGTDTSAYGLCGGSYFNGCDIDWSGEPIPDWKEAEVQRVPARA